MNSKSNDPLFGAPLSRPWLWAGLIAATVVAAGLRLYDLEGTPPGMNQDEAVNAYNAWCLLKTGKDVNGDPWPIFYTHGNGANQTTLMLYAIMPFQAVFGLSVWSARLHGVFFAIASVPIAFYIGRRMFGGWGGLVAAGLIAICPWSVHLSRWAIDSSICPFLTLASLALLLAANLLPDGSDDTPPPRPWWAVAAGAAWGVACYAYWSQRIFLVLAGLGIAAVAWRSFVRLARTARGRLALAGFFIAFAATFGPLAQQTLMNQQMNRRGDTQLVWKNPKTADAPLDYAAGMYLAQLGPDFLFVSGDAYAVTWGMGRGMLHWVYLPLLAAGFVWCVLAARRSIAARVLLVMLLAYPVTGALSHSWYVHSLRASSGMPALILISAAGAAALAQWSRRVNPKGPIAVAVAALLVAGVETGLFARSYLTEHSKKLGAYHGYQADLAEACRWLRANQPDWDIAFITAEGMNLPNWPAQVHLGYDPHRWHEAEREVYHRDEHDRYYRVGDLYFMYEDLWRPHFGRITGNGQPDRVAMVVRPSRDVAGMFKRPPNHEIVRPDGRVVLWLYLVTI